MPTTDQSQRRTFLADYPVLRPLLLACLTVIMVGAAGRVVSEAGVLVSAILVPAAISVLLTGLLMPFQVLFNHRLRLPRALAAAVTILGALGLLGGLMWVAGQQLAQGMEDIVATLSDQLRRLRAWVVDTLPIGQEEITEAIGQAQAWIESNQAGLAQGAFGAGVGALGLMVQALLTLVVTFFFLSQGDRIWTGLVMLLPQRWRRRTYEASRRGWVTLGTYCRTQLLVSAVDAAGIGLGAAILGVPFVIPLVAITFVLCFIPYAGAIVSGALVVGIALAFQGPTTALVMLAIVIAVQQLESNVLSPFLMGRAVDVHPLVILLSVAGATYVLGLVGALFMVPVIATIKSMVVYLNDNDPFPGLATGGRALTDSPRTLMGDRDDPKSPPRIGEATPTWLRREEAEANGEPVSPGATRAEAGPDA